MEYSAIKTANESIKTMPIERRDKKTGKVTTSEYAEVNQRIKAFRMIFPDGFILTEMASNENGVCVFRAQAGYYDNESGRPVVLGTGTAYEKEGSSFINDTSYIENCETSAVGRCLGFLGLGIDTSVASAEEVQNAKLQQEEMNEERKASPKQVELIGRYYRDENLQKLLDTFGVQSLEDLPMQKASDVIRALKESKR